MASNEDFELQLKLEAEEAKRNENQVAENDNPYLTRDPNDGTLYEWDPDKKAWFPKIDENFIAMYQASYGFNQDESKADISATKTAEQAEQSKLSSTSCANQADANVAGCSKRKESEVDATEEKQGESNPKKNKKQQQQPEWFNIEDDHNTKVYVSNLPEDVNEEEFVELMSKCGLIMKDANTNKFKIKLYKDANGQAKGDGLCTYIKVESVQLAEQILDGYQFKGKQIKVEKAKFELKGEYDPNKKPRKAKPKDKQKMKQKMEKLFSWKPDKLRGERPNCEKVVILKNMFDPKEFAQDPTLILEYRSDVLKECEESCGPVKKVEIFDCHPEGVVSVFFKEFDAADACVQLMNGRWFAQRQLSAHHWDGRTRYKMQETEEETEKRIAEWDRYLNQ